nr:hypothetical protein [Angustibacter aerolatus]
MSKDPTIGVLALQGDVREHLVALAESGATARPVRRPEEPRGPRRHRAARGRVDHHRQACRASSASASR